MHCALSITQFQALLNLRRGYYKLQSRCTLKRQFSPKVAHKGRDKEKLRQFTVSGWLIINAGASDNEKENFKAEIIFNMKCPYNYKSVQSALSDLKRPPERLQSQCNYRLFIT